MLRSLFLWLPIMTQLITMSYEGKICFYVLQLFSRAMPIVKKLASFSQNGAVALTNILTNLCSSINFSCGGDKQHRECTSVLLNL